MRGSIGILINFDKIKWDNKLRFFQFNITRASLKTNYVVHYIKPHVQPYCAYCGIEQEKIQHLFFQCHLVQGLWQEIADFFLQCNIHIPLNIKNVLFGFHSAAPDSIENYVMLTVKYYIWANKFRTPMAPLSLNIYKKILKKRLNELESVANLLNNASIIDKWFTVRLLL